MATRREPLQIEAQVIDAESENVQAQVDADNYDEAQIASELGRADGDTHFLFKVHKYKPQSKEMIFCTEATLADLPLIPKIQKQWGEGKYRVQVLKNGKFHNRYDVSVAAPPSFQTQNPAPQIGGNDPAVINLLRELIEAQKTKNEPAQKFGVTEFAAIVTAAVPVIALIKDMMPKRADPLSQVKDLLEITNQLKPNDALPEREPSIVEVIGNVLTKTDLLGTLGALANPNAQPAPQQKQIGAPQTITPEQQQAALMGHVKAQLAGLVECAKKNKDPELYAAVVIDQLSDAMPEMVQQLALPGAIDYVCMIHEPCATYRSWFEALLTSIREQLSEEEAPSEPPAAHVSGTQTVFTPNPAPNQAFDHSSGNAWDESDAALNGEVS